MNQQCVTTDMEKRSDHVMASSTMQFQSGVFRFFADHTCKDKCKQNASSIFTSCCLSLYLHAQTTVHMHLTNHTYLDHRKRMNTTKGASCRNKDFPSISVVTTQQACMSSSPWMQLFYATRLLVFILHDSLYSKSLVLLHHTWTVSPLTCFEEALSVQRWANRWANILVSLPSII